jgi:integrase
MKDGDSYVVREAPLKTRASRRTIDLSPALLQTLLAVPAGDDPERDYVFRSQTGRPLDPDNVDRAFKPHLALAGLSEEVRFHDLRHTHASLLIAAGVHPKAIQARLGHTSITTTLNRYGHLMPDAFAGVGERLDTLLAAGRQRRGVAPATAQAPVKAPGRHRNARAEAEVVGNP